MEKKRILFLPFDHVGLLEMMPTAKKILADGKYRPLFYLSWFQLFKQEHFDYLENADIEIYDRESTQPKYAYKNRTIITSVKDYFRESFLFGTLWKTLASIKNLW